MTLLEEIRVHRQEILDLGKKYGITDIRVFGSVARGEEDENSDIDFLVNLDKQNYKDPFDFIRFKEASETLLNRKVDIVFEKGVRKPLYEEIVLNSEII
jgi:predicted nucleotidyltransferase